MKIVAQRRVAARVSRGIGMIDVLIVIVVLAVGALAISRMQLEQLRANQSALQRSQVSILAYELVDIMRTDRQSALAAAYDRDFGDARPATVTPLANAELTRWLDALEARLPGGDGEVSTTGNTVTVSVRWLETRDPAAPTTFTAVSGL